MRQNLKGVEAFDAWRAKSDPATRMSVTGHSLGGGIATYISLHRENVSSFIFNASPRFRKGAAVIENKRVSIVESGDGLKVGRLFGREADQIYTSLNCTRGFNPIRQHSIRLLAECLTRIAAFESLDARASLVANGITPLEGTPQ